MEHFSLVTAILTAIHHHHHAALGPKAYARSLFPRFHWKHWEFKYLNDVFNRESGWYKYACNPYSGAYGIPQALPGSKMASAGKDWATDARTQIRWGLGYIKAVYRTPYWAWQHELGFGWY